MLKKLLMTTAAIAAFSLSQSVFSEDSNSNNAAGTSGSSNAMMSVRNACKNDLNKYCKDVNPGQGREFSCLRAHEDQLSSDCHTQWMQSKAKMRQTMKEAKNACGTDVKKFCADSMGPREVSSCLRSHDADLSDSCRSYQKSHPQMGGVGRPDDSSQPVANSGNTNSQPNVTSPDSNP